MFCKNCGKQLDDSARFCPDCGSAVGQGDGSGDIQVPKRSFRHDISKIWPEWQIEKQLGRGSYGVVYQVGRKDEITGLETKAAVKVISIPADASEADSLRSEGIGEEGSRTYFKRIVDGFVGEIRLMDSLKGTQNIVNVEDYKVVEKQDVIGWDIYIRMELLTPFNTYMQTRTLTEDEVIKLGCDICSALEICAEQNIIHRDIKPENIFLNKFGHFKLGDFGIARKLENSTGGLSQKGTFNYMAPEVAAGTNYGVGADIYSLGIVLYRLLNANRLPFLENEQQVLNPEERKKAVERRIRGERLPAPCQASPAMAELVLRACDFDPARRFATATEMKDALMAVKYGAPSAKPAAAPVEEDLDRTVSIFSARARAEEVKPEPEVEAKPQPKVEAKPQSVVTPVAEPVSSNGFHPSDPNATAWDSTVNMRDIGGQGVAPQPEIRPQPAPQPAPRPAVAPVEPQPSEAKPKSKKKLWLIIAGVVVLIAVVAVVLVVVLGDSSGSDKSKRSGSSTTSSTTSSSESSSTTSSSENSVVGKYMVYSYSTYNQDGEFTNYGYDVIKTAGLQDSYIEFNDDGTASIYMVGEGIYNCTYDPGTGTLYVEETYETCTYRHGGNSVTLVMPGGDQWTFKK